MMGHYTIPAWVAFATLLSYLAVTPRLVFEKQNLSFHFNQLLKVKNRALHAN